MGGLRVGGTRSSGDVHSSARDVEFLGKRTMAWNTQHLGLENEYAMTNVAGGVEQYIGWMKRST